MSKRLIVHRPIRTVRFAAAAVIFTLSASATAWAQQGTDSPVFRAGAAISNITPLLGGEIVGGFEPRPSSHVHDELHARCIVLDDGRTRLVIVVCDNVGISREVFDDAKQRLHEATGLPIENMLMSATHTHSAVSARGTNALVPASPLTDYQQFLALRIVDGVRRAINNLQPARIGWGAGTEPSQVFNRRWFLKPGVALPNPFGGYDKVMMNPGRANPDLVEPAGPTDPQIAFFTIQSRDGRPIALLANYSLHYVGGVGDGHISADYFAVFADRIQQLLGADRLDPPFVGVMTNGTSGNINNINFRKPSPRQAPYEQIHKVANQVAAEVFKAHQYVEFHDRVELAAMVRELDLAVRKPTPEMVEYANRVMARSSNDKPFHRRQDSYAGRTLQLAESPDRIAVPLQVLRIGDLGIAAIPFEVFVETGLEIKDRGPFERTFTISLANGSYGYLPTPEHHALGGYETWLGTNRVEVQASRKITDALLEMFGKLEN